MDAGSEKGVLSAQLPSSAPLEHAEKQEISAIIPIYPEHIAKRIFNARLRALEMGNRRAWWVGHNDRTGADVYAVYSSDQEGHAYYITVYRTPNFGGYVYALPGIDGPTIRWMLCECPAGDAGTYGLPCWHAAKVQLRLEREAVR